MPPAIPAVLDRGRSANGRAWPRSASPCGDERQKGGQPAGVAGPKKGILGPISGKMRFPDKLTKDVLKEAKNVKYQGWTAQLKDSAAIAKEKGVPFVLSVRTGTGTVLSKPLLAAEEAGLVTILREIGKAQ